MFKKTDKKEQHTVLKNTVLKLLLSTRSANPHNNIFLWKLPLFSDRCL